MLKSLLLYSAFLGLSLNLLSCKNDEQLAEVTAAVKQNTPPEFTEYIILKNNHYTSNNIGAVKSNKLKFVARFNHSAIYTTTDKQNQADINKLYGFSDCGTHHQENSARFGWRWFNNQLEIFAYTYQNKVRQEKFIKAVELNKEAEYELVAQDNKYTFRIDDTLIEMERGCTGYYDKYKLFPYFGGDEVAPHDIKILIKEIK